MPAKSRLYERLPFAKGSFINDMQRLVARLYQALLQTHRAPEDGLC